ncbi:hypothetical protein H4N49_10540 [Streptomyces sp. DHE17-7]|nr:hypothetical protein [Streptomyces sp. DHE17-7]
MLAAPHQVGGPGLQRAGVELGGGEQRVLRGHLVGLPQRGVRIGGPGGLEQLPDLRVGQLLQAPQHIGRARGRGQGGQPLVQGEFVGAARAREELEAAHLGQQRRQLGPLGPRGPLERAARLQRRAQHPQADQGVAGVDGTAGRLGRDHRGRRPVPGEGPLGEGVRGQDAAAPPEARRQHQIGQADQARIVLDERGLGLFDVDDGTGRGGGRRCGARGDIL